MEKRKRLNIQREDDSSEKRLSSERRRNAQFIAICKTCGSYMESTTNEVSSYIHEHMCESPDFDMNSGKKVISLMMKKLEAVERDSQSKTKMQIATKNDTKSLVDNKKSPLPSQTLPQPPPPPPPPPPQPTAKICSKLGSGKRNRKVSILSLIII